MKPAFLYVVLALLMNSPLIHAEGQGEMLYEGKTLDQWIEQLQTGGYRSCLDAIDAIGHFGPKASRTTLLLEKIQKNPDFRSFGEVARIALLRIRPEKNVPRLIEMLSPTQDRKVRLGALHDLYYFGPSAASATPELYRIINDNNDRSTQLDAIVTLAQIGVGGEELLPGLLQQMWEAKDPFNKRKLLYAISSFGDAARPAIPEILALLSHEDGTVRSFAALALARLDCPRETIIPALLKMLQESDPGSRIMAASCLVHYVPPDDATVRALILALQDSQNDVRSHAVDSLGDFGEYARPALPALMLTALQDTSTGLGSAAYDAIKQIEYRMPGRE